jgi:hypothetical protein
VISSRRQFIKGLSFAALTPMIARAGKVPRLPLAFSTLGCPAWEWNKILEFASQHGFAAIELRGLEGNLDLPAHPFLRQNASSRPNARSTRASCGLRASAVRPTCTSPIRRNGRRN